MDFKLILSLASLVVCIDCYISIRRTRIAFERSVKASTQVVESHTALRGNEPGATAKVKTVVTRSY